MKRIQLEKRTDLKSEIPLETPYCIFVDPSSCCNFKCTFCMNQKMKVANVMKFDLFQKVIDDLQEFKSPVKTIRLYGFGEPLINPRFCDMVKYAKSSDRVLGVDTTTNASLLDDNLIASLVDSEIDRINVSVEAMSTEKYVSFTRNKSVSFEEIVQNVGKLFGAKRKTVIFAKINGDYLSEDEKRRFIETFSPITDGCDIEHTMNCWRDFQVDNVNKEVGIYGQPLKEVMVCPYVFYSFMVHSDGYASLCFLDWNKKLIVGDAKNESLKSLWQDAAFDKFRKMMLHKERKDNPICRNCQQLVAGMPVDLDDHAEGILKRLQV
jgi:MoaA/NifB/PqqE/SkfB family radical SAM enzyme